MPKNPKSPGGRESQRHNPLVEEYVPSNPWKQKSKRQKQARDEADGDHFVDSKSSKKILEIGRDLAEEDEKENQARQPSVANPAFDFETRLGEDEDLTAQYEDEEEVWGDEEEEVEEIDIDPSDLATFNKFLPTDENPITWPGDEVAPQGPGTDLAALILEKIAMHEQANPQPDRVLGGGAPEDAIELPAKVVEVYSKIGLIMSRYKSGKLPKPFKILPTIPAWETLVSITRPDAWTPNSMYAATRLFISSNPQTAQTFLSTLLLPAIQQDIHESNKLNIHYYNSLKKALYKPASFFKGIVFPMLADGTCTQREATIVASVVTKGSFLTRDSSAAALQRLCELSAEQMSSDPDAAGPVNIFIKALLEKKYALPYKVVDALVFHFLRFRAAGASSADAMDTESVAGDLGGSGKLPVIWHQCLLAFAQRYRNDVTEDQREALLDLLLTRGHKTISPEVRRELLEGRGRGVVLEPPPIGTDGDDTMVMAID
ncbi:rRNA processing protein-like protein Bystin [Pleomassaria siparia CBS 279.74]|uniref:rRNA processing protein-like protein Bystin n=1 Tax=Pleomassaria siparia CBS 279.74 TaxID=1314801 RepID=A0A6G1KAZ2_9PLEO|nr:rRNA processing protein-like protein Bystin [Pleomassaria siparia CBS 279.74]